jgi:flagellin-like protein
MIDPSDQGSESSDRGVSPVIGVVLMAAVAVVLAAVVAMMAFGFEDRLRDPAPNGGFEQEYVASGADNTNDRPYVTITHQVGRTVDAENVVIKDEAGNTITWNNIWTGGPKVKATEYIHLDGFSSDSVLQPICEVGDTYTIILQDDQGRALIVNEWEAPRDPNLTPGSSSDSDGDGIPDWC